MLESDLVQLEKSGIEIGHAETIKKEEIVDTDLFELDIRMQAKKMSDLYFLLHCLENSIRRLISERLHDEYGANWWNTEVPSDVQTAVKEKQKKEKDTPMVIRSDDPLLYTNFGDLIKIIEHKWDDFSDTIRSPKSMRETLTRLNQLRNPIAHTGDMDDDEITRYLLSIKDWLRIQM